MGARTSGGSSISRWDLRAKRTSSAQEPASDQAGPEPDINEQPESASARVGELEARVESLLEEIDRLRQEMESLARFRTLIDGADEAIFVVNADTGRFVDANRTALRWFGIARDRLMSLSIRDVGAEFPLEYPRAVGGRVNDTRDNPRPLICGRVHRRKDGSVFPVEVAVALRRFGNHTYTLVVARESKRWKEDSKELSQQYQALFRLTRDAVCICDGEGSITDANEALAELLAYRRAEMIGLAVSDLLVGTSSSLLFELAVEESGLLRNERVRLRKQDGTVLAGEMTLSALNVGAGQRTRFQCIVRPVRTDAEAKRKLDRQADHKKVARRVLHYSLVAISIAVAVFSWTDVVALTYPYPAGLQVWQWGLRLLSPVLVVLSLAHPRWRYVSRVVSIGLATIVVALLVTYVNYMLGMPYDLATAVEGADVQIHQAMLAASGFSLVCVLVFGWISRRLWVGQTEPHAADFLE